MNQSIFDDGVVEQRLALPESAKYIQQVFYDVGRIYKNKNRIRETLTLSDNSTRLAICREPCEPGLCKIFRAWVMF